MKKKNKYNNGFIVKYHNNTHDLITGNLTSVELDMLMVVFAKIKGKGSKTIYLSELEMRRLSGYEETNPQKIRNCINRFADKIFNLEINFEDEIGKRRIRAHVFEEFVYEDKELTIKLANTFYNWFNCVHNNFTRFTLPEFVSVKGKYSKQLYRLLKQFRTSGELRITVEDFRLKVGVPNSYKNYNLIQKVLKPAINELNNYFENLYVNYVVKDLYGRNYELTINQYKDLLLKPQIIGFHFVFEPEKMREQTAYEEKWLEENVWEYE